MKMMGWRKGNLGWVFGPYRLRKIRTVDGKGPMFWLYKNSHRVNFKTGGGLTYNSSAEECHSRNLVDAKRKVENINTTQGKPA